MGVLGLTPFLQKNCPEVIKKLPDRLRSFRGKTIVIDGTLITQRLHFASVPWKHRHVLGWYKIIQELKESGVSTICVFDGQERNKAKAREIARRQEVKNLSVARGSIEVERLKRLRKAISLVGDSKQSGQRERVSVALKDARELGARVVGMGRKTGLASMDGVSSSDHASRDTDTVQGPESESEFEYTIPSSDLHDILLARIDQSINAWSWPSDPDSLVEEDFRLGVLEEEETLGKTFKAQEDLLLPDADVYPSSVVDEDLVLVAPRDDDQAIQELLTLEQPASLNDDDTSRSTSQLQPKYANTQTDIDYSNMQYNQNEEQEPPLEKALAGDSITAQEQSLPAKEPSRTTTTTTTATTTAANLGILIRSAEEDVPRPTKTKDIPSELASLYLEYYASIPKLTSLSPPPKSLSSAELKSVTSSVREESPDDQDSDQVEYAMSKQQLQLTIDEGKFWDELVDDKSRITQPKLTPDTIAPDSPTDPGVGTQLITSENTAEEILVTLAEKSSLISESYERRNNPPTAQTYEECKEIIRAMGVPCLDSAGPYEAEALAASLVIKGHADYVASEDTDVLVYEAPLIRNLTSRVEPLTIVNGSDIRAVLDLSRASFIDFALLLGTDFSQRIKHVGPQRALKFIRLHGSIEAIIQHEPKYPPRVPEKVYLEQVAAARGVFRTLPEVPDLRLLAGKESDKEAVAGILQRYGLHRASKFDWDYNAALEGNYFQDNPSAF